MSNDQNPPELTNRAVRLLIELDQVELATHVHGLGEALYDMRKLMDEGDMGEKMNWPKGIGWNHTTQSWDYYFREGVIDSLGGEFAASYPEFAKSWENRLDALTAAYDHIESMLVHVSHGGPTLADGQRLHAQLKATLAKPRAASTGEAV